MSGEPVPAGPARTGSRSRGRRSAQTDRSGSAGTGTLLTKLTKSSYYMTNLVVKARRLVMTRLNVNDARCAALFASGLQRSDAPTPEALAEVISRTVRQFGITGCAQPDGAGVRRPPGGRREPDAMDPSARRRDTRPGRLAARPPRAAGRPPGLLARASRGQRLAVPPCRLEGGGGVRERGRGGGGGGVVEVTRGSGSRPT